MAVDVSRRPTQPKVVELGGLQGLLPEGRPVEVQVMPPRQAQGWAALAVEVVPAAPPVVELGVHTAAAVVVVVVL